MTYYKFVLLTYISISFYGFHTTETSSLLATPKNKTITKTTAATKTTLDTVVNAKTDKTVSVTFTVLWSSFLHCCKKRINP